MSLAGAGSTNPLPLLIAMPLPVQPRELEVSLVWMRPQWKMRLPSDYLVTTIGGVWKRVLRGQGPLQSLENLLPVRLRSN